MGERLWGEKGILIGNGYKEFASFHDLHIMSDGSGGAFTIWSAYPEKPDFKQAPRQRQIPYLTHLGRVDTQGNLLWQKEVRYVDNMVSDGGGGVIVGTDRNGEGTSSIVKINADGTFSWGEDGVRVQCVDYSDHSFKMAADGYGGVIFIWQEGKTVSGEWVTLLYSQKINAEGNLL